MVRTIKPQRAQRITESCYFSLLPPLRPSVVFRNLISKVSKSLRDFETLPREIPKTHKSSKTTEIYTYMSNASIGRIKSPLDSLQIKGGEDD